MPTHVCPLRTISSLAPAFYRFSPPTPKCHAGCKHCSPTPFLRLAGELMPTLQETALVTKKNTHFSACAPVLSKDNYFCQSNRKHSLKCCSYVRQQSLLYITTTVLCLKGRDLVSTGVCFVALTF